MLSSLSDKAFDRPICEALLNQKYFNGIGNYLRAEILYRFVLTLLRGINPQIHFNLCTWYRISFTGEALLFHSFNAELEYCMPTLSTP